VSLNRGLITGLRINKRLNAEWTYTDRLRMKLTSLFENTSLPSHVEIAREILASDTIRRERPRSQHDKPLSSVMTTQAVFILVMHAADVCGVLEQWSRERPATARALQRHRETVVEAALRLCLSLERDIFRPHERY